jgi:FG-GAP repeat protein
MLMAALLLLGVANLAAGATMPDSLRPPGQEVGANDGAPGDEFGISVAVDGDTALIGASYENAGQGAAYVFTRSNGVWSEAQKLTASDGAANDWFGQSVALDGDTAVIGAPQYLNFGNGAAYVFTRSGGGWSESQKLTADDGVGRDQFGISVAVAGSDVLVGAYGIAFYQGAAYAFAESGGSWAQTQKLVADDASQNADFGVSVALDGATALIGAYGDASYQGAAYVFDNAGGMWSETQKLVASDGAADAHFGISVALDGTHALVGAEGATVGANSHQGEAYAFSNAGGTWSETQAIVASNGAAWDYFGRSVSLDGPNAMVGAYGVNAQQGGAYLFSLAGDHWSENAALTASDAAGGDQYGIWVALAGTTALVGASGADNFQGAAYFYALPANDTIFANGFDP